MAQWEPGAASDLMTFAANNSLDAEVGNFQAQIDAWADGLGGPANQRFPFGRYTAEVTASAGQVLRIEFDM